MAARILCVDPDGTARAETAEHLADELAGLDPRIETAGSLAGARETADSFDAGVDCVVTEYALPDGTGAELIAEVRDRAPDAGCILFTAADPDSLDTSALAGSAIEYVGKESPLGDGRLARLVRTTVETRAQASYPLPQSEEERIAALRTYDLDDPGLQASLDRVTDLAVGHVGVDTASVNIISEHSQEFLACRGRSETWETMDRTDSICAFTILEDRVMTVEDVTDDPRFESRSETLRDLGIRSYMGANLTTPGGLVVGTLCVYDDEPRSFPEAEQQYLQTLAAVAMDLIDTYSRLDGATAGEGPDR
jgi:DNA-binding NarL/FixJ family response regulator